MKKLLPLLLLLLAACSKSDNTDITPTTQTQHRSFTIAGENSSAGWLYTNGKNNPSEAVSVNGNYYFHSEKMVDIITSEVCENGKVDVYLQTGGTQSKLPYIRNYISTGHTWTTTIDFVYEPGYVHIYHTRSDFPDNEAVPAAETFRVVTSL